MDAFGLWEEAGGPGESPHRHMENMQTAERNAGNEPRTFLPLALSAQ